MTDSKLAEHRRNILIADDDLEDGTLVKEIFLEFDPELSMSLVENGEQVLQYLELRSGHLNKIEDLPAFILLDLNMPKMNGFETLRALKEHPVFRRIPIIILSTSHSEEDICRSYRLGANSFLTKPTTYQEFLIIVKDLVKYWFQISQLPDNEETSPQTYSFKIDSQTTRFTE